MRQFFWVSCIAALSIVGCEGSRTPSESAGSCEHRNTPGATAGCIDPTFPETYYVQEALAYFDTLDTEADRASVPNYHPLVARWEWPPWLLLTGYTADAMIESSDLLLRYDPSTVPERDCRFFETQPFARCYVTFVYERGPCPIYEEFTFDSQGRTIFIEAWSHLPGLTPIQGDDTWAERDDFPRLSTRVPGLGAPDAVFDLDNQYLRAAAETDQELSDFALRATDWTKYWLEALTNAQPDFFGVGCGWETDSP